jgi:hypothetical protein
MSALLMVGAVLGFVALLVGVALLIFRKTRSRGKWIAGAGAVAMVLGVAFGPSMDAAERGFATTADANEARQLGVGSQAELDAARAARAAAAAERAAAERAEAEERARVEAAAAAERAAAERAEAEAREQEELRQIAEAAAQETERRQAEEAACRADLRCWGERHGVEAEVQCRRPVEGLARIDFRWTNGWLTPRFSRFRWRNEEAGVITYIGSEIELQNGFGNWVRHRYECDFDTLAQRPVEVRAAPGRVD